MSVLLHKETLEYFIQQYFANFHCIYPFLDRSLLCIPVWGWALYLAAAAIGARYLCIYEVTLFGDNLCSLLHEILLIEIEFGRVEDSLPYIQARVLTTVGLCHSRENSLMKCGYNAAALVFNSCLRLRLLEEDDRIGAFEAGQDAEQAWIAWRFRETRRRTGFFIHLTDSTFAFMTQTPPRLPLQLLKLREPCPDNLWEADTCHHWFRHREGDEARRVRALSFHDEEQSRAHLQDTFRKMWKDLRLPRPLTDFGTTALIHILIRRIWDGPWYVERPEEAWSRHQRNEDNVVTIYPAAIHEFSQWRNSTCDCLDILHWEALSLSAKAGGLEGPLFLQLHLARLLLLTPVRQLLSHFQASVRFPINNLLPHDLYNVPEADAESRQVLAVWAKQDRHKARLAVIHAGAIFWHVRRFSSDSFVQPFAVFLAAITLWAYGKFSQKPSSAPYNGSASNVNVDCQDPPEQMATRLNLSGVSLETSLDRATSPLTASHSIPELAAGIRPRCRMPNFMQLDRPMDDELVQHFIRAGEEMTLHLEGVESLSSDQGIEQVLREAILILSESKTIWSVSDNYVLGLDAVVGP